jgi:hypothetical protein
MTDAHYFLSFAFRLHTFTFISRKSFSLSSNREIIFFVLVIILGFYYLFANLSLLPFSLFLLACSENYS